jgi:YbbR domain-containing protein
MRLPALRIVRRASPGDAPSSPQGPTPPWWRMLDRLRPRDLRAALRHNRGLKLVSLLLAFFLWFSINVSERDAERVLELPVVVRKLPPDLIVVNAPDRAVSATLRGPRTILDGVDEQRGRIALDLSAATPGEMRIELAPDMLRPDLPRRLKLVRLEPQRLKVQVERLLRRRVPVRAELAGAPALGYMTAESSVRPAEVEVAGPKSKVEDLKEVRTEPLDMQGLEHGVQRNALLAWAGDLVSFTPDHVLVTISVEEVSVSREFKDVPVAVLNAGGRQVALEPPHADVTLSGPQRLLHNFKLDDGVVSVDADDLPSGAHRVTVQVALPATIEVTRRRPEQHTLRIGGGS